VGGSTLYYIILYYIILYYGLCVSLSLLELKCSFYFGTLGIIFLKYATVIMWHSNFRVPKQNQRKENKKCLSPSTPLKF